jgi:hypothetical protein
MDLPPFVKKQIDINRRERDEKIKQLPITPQNLLLSFLKDHQVAENLILKQKSDGHVKEEVETALQALNPYTPFGFNNYFIKLATTPSEFDVRVMLEISIQSFVNRVVFINDVRQLIDMNIEMIIAEFCPKVSRSINPNQLTFQIKTFNAIPCNYGKIPLFITFLKEGTPLFKIVYKPRNAAIDKAVIDTLAEINRLPSNKKSSQLRLPVYKIINSNDYCLEEFVEGEHIKSKETIGTYLRAHLKGSRLARANERIARLYLFLFTMGIADLHNENIQVKNLNDPEKDLEFFPIDLDIRTSFVPTLIKETDKAILTAAENRVIDEFYMPKARLATMRFLPMFHVLRGIGNYQACPEIAKEFIEFLTAEDIEVTMTLQNMEHHLLINLLNHDVPHFIIYLGNLYYEIVGEEHLIGKVKE